MKPPIFWIELRVNTSLSRLMCSRHCMGRIETPENLSRREVR